MAIEIIPVSTPSDVEVVADLAREIWSQHFTPIIGESQVEYMLKRFQNAEAISTQIESGGEYYLARRGSEFLAYTCIVPEAEFRKLMLSKIYVRHTERGLGIGKTFLQFIEKKCVTENLSRIWLTVNRDNEQTIAWYKRRGFAIVDEVKKDIGEGFFMDDYIMEKTVESL